jgi:hypothetical protein
MRSGLQRCNYYFHYDNLEAYTFLPSSESKKKFVVEKMQLSINDDAYYLGALAVYLKGKYFFIYSDNPKNETKIFKSTTLHDNANIHIMNSSRKANVILATVEENGNTTKKLLFNNGDNKTVFVPQKSLVLANGKVVLYSKRNNKFRIGVIQLGN